jgi:uncharacterized protein (DUF2252 family)
MPAITERIHRFNAGRVPELLALKYQFISEDPFRFYRGTCHLFYEDLARHISWKDETRAWICGDLHLENFGSYKGDNRIIYFDMNDFDEALQAPATWELVRMLTSIHVAARSVPYDKSAADALCQLYLNSYLQVLQSGKPVVIEKETAQGLLKYFLQQVQARKENEFVGTRTQIKKGKLQLRIDNKKALAAPDQAKDAIIPWLNDWFSHHEATEKYKVADIAYRIAGTGSVGCQRYMVLVREKKAGAFHLLDLKEARPSSLQPYSHLAQPEWENEAQRIVALQKRVQHVSPALLDVVMIHKTPFVIKELQPSADRMDLSLCKGKQNRLGNILITMAQTNASGQLRSTGRQGSSIADELMAFAGHSKQWQAEVLQYAKKYAQQVLTDYQAYCRQYKNSAGN